MYHTTGLDPIYSICSSAIPASQLIDDRHIGQMRPTTSNLSWSNFDLAKASVFVSALALVLCGYFIGLKKSIFVPAQVLKGKFTQKIIRFTLVNFHTSIPDPMLFFMSLPLVTRYSSLKL